MLKITYQNHYQIICENRKFFMKSLNLAEENRDEKRTQQQLQLDIHFQHFK